jgi:predicted DCC family thiol-disulfide oxidoreductase YuxK
MDIPGYNDRPILFFDGVCNLCNNWVQYVLKHDRNKRIVFASLQSPYGQKVLQELKEMHGSVPDSLLLYCNSKFYTRSAAALKTAGLMGGAWPLLTIGFIIPSFLRNAIYDGLARKRYKWFGKRDSCMVPTPELAARFLPG